MNITTCPTSIKQCKSIKPISDFYYHVRDGYETVCKCCRKVIQNKYRINNREVIRQKNKEEYSRNITKRKEYKKEYRANNLKKNLAHVRVYRAKRSGVIKTASVCNCGQEARVAHHADYNKPLMVVWLCDVCHIRLHKSSGATAVKELLEEDKP